MLYEKRGILARNKAVRKASSNTDKIILIFFIDLYNCLSQQTRIKNITKKALFK